MWDELHELMPLCEKRLIRVREIADKLQAAEMTIAQLLQAESVAGRVFDRLRKESITRWWRDQPEYASAEDCTRVAQMLGVIWQVKEQLQPEFLNATPVEKSQIILPAGDEYQAKKLLWDLLKRASQHIVIVDSYLDDEVFPFIESLDTSVAVQLVTADKKPIFRSLLAALQKKRNDLEARQSSAFHDRFIIIDQTEVWHLGASLNGLGTKICMLSRVADPDGRDRFLQLFASAWSSGSAI